MFLLNIKKRFTAMVDLFTSLRVIKVIKQKWFAALRRPFFFNMAPRYGRGEHESRRRSISDDVCRCV